MQKFNELERGKLIKGGKEFDYVIEIAKDFPRLQDRNIRIRVLHERPVVRKLRTRYDPEIEAYGDKNASMDVVLGYDMKEINKSLRFFIFTLLSPFYIAGVYLIFTELDKIPVSVLPHWAKFVLVPLLVFLLIIMLRQYYRMNMNTLAEYLKSRDIKKVLEKEGFKQ